MVASQSKAPKSQMIAWIPKKLDLKTGFLDGTQGQVKLVKKAKTCPHYDFTHRKPQTQNKKKFFQSKLEDFSNLLKV